jgi:phospholipid/cholesterol/gamma-HCH transport system substrate-binding protein
MKSFSERNPLIICAVGVSLTIAVVVGALNYKLLPFFNNNKHYSAYFAEAGGLIPGAAVQVRGFRVGQVDRLDLDDVGVLINFNVSKDIRLGERTEATIKTKSLLGAKTLEIIPRGSGQQDGPIPIDRTRSPYQLPDALGDLSATISGLNTDQLSQSLEVLSNTFKDTPPDLKVAVAGVARFSQTLDARDAELRNLLANANKTTGVLAQRSDQVVSLIANTNALLVALESQSAALEQISGRISSVTRQLKGFIAENQDTLRPALDKLNDVLTIVDNHKADIQKSIKGLNAYATSLGESVSSGPFFKAYVANLLPGQFVQPFIDAAFSDLGVDPATLLPSQRADPQLGQPGTPPLPLPYPRTGQGGEPNRNLPGAITGKPDDPRYPYRPPLPAPPPGGPPPGPPAPPPPEQRSAPETSPPPVYVPAPLEVPPHPGAGR